MKRDIYADVSARILKNSKRAPPLGKPWSATAGQNIPQNAVTIDHTPDATSFVMARPRSRLATARFLTFKQAIDAGACRLESPPACPVWGEGQKRKALHDAAIVCGGFIKHGRTL